MYFLFCNNYLFFWTFGIFFSTMLFYQQTQKRDLTEKREELVCVFLFGDFLQKKKGDERIKKKSKI